jgi:NAD-dependent DNA ligase
MTGFRDAALETRARAAGWAVADSLTSKVTVLLVPDGDMKESGKVKAAREKGIKIMQRSKFLV